MLQWPHCCLGNPQCGTPHAVCHPISQPRVPGVTVLFLLQRGRRCLSLSASSLQRPLGTGVLLLHRTLRTAASAWTPSAISSSCGASLAASTPSTTSAYLSGWPQAISAALCADGTQSNVHGQIKIRLQALPEVYSAHPVYSYVDIERLGPTLGPTSKSAFGHC